MPIHPHNAASLAAVRASLSFGNGHAAPHHMLANTGIIYTGANATASVLQSQYTDSIKNYLLIGFLGFFLAAVVFAFMGFKNNHKLPETLTFLIAVIATGSYYLMSTGYGVVHKTEENDVSVYIFWARYIDQLFTTPLILLNIALLVNAEAGEIVMLLGNDVIMVLASAIGATQLSPYKWIWWVISMVFFVLVFLQLFGFLTKVGGKEDTESPLVQGVKILVALTFISWCFYPILWVLGSEGLATISLDLEVGLVCFADLVSKLGFGFYLIFAVCDSTKPADEADGAERTSLV